MGAKGSFDAAGASRLEDEAARVLALERLHILDTPPEPSFDDITALAVALFRVPIALVTFVDANRQWFKSRVGLDVGETEREIAFCAHTVVERDLFVIEDARRDRRFHENPLVVGGPRVRFYAGAPLELPSGHVVGSLGILDTAPRALDEQEREHLRRLARLVVDAIALRNRTAVAQAEASRAFSEERRTRVRLSRSEERRAAIVDAALAGILLVEEDGIICEANPAASRILGRSKVELVRHPLADLLVRPSLGGTGARLADELRARDAPAFRGLSEISVRGPDGRDIPVEVSIAVVPEEPPLYAVFVRDLTERRALEAQLRDAQKMEAVGRLAGGIAHDFNNLLSVVLVVGQLAQKKLAPGDPLIDDLETIVQGARRASVLTRQLLAIGRQQSLQTVAVDLGAMVIDAEPLLRRLVGTDVELDLALDPSTPAVEGDPGQLQRVLMNLVINARDATPAGGRITVRTAAVDLDAAEARVHGAAAGRHVVLSVRDTGRGMDPATRDRIFEPFFTTKEQGSGLGLAIVAGIVKQSRGHLAVDSAIGQGSTFSVRLPPMAPGPPGTSR